MWLVVMRSVHGCERQYSRLACRMVFSDHRTFQRQNAARTRTVVVGGCWLGRSQIVAVDIADYCRSLVWWVYYRVDWLPFAKYCTAISCVAFDNMALAVGLWYTFPFWQP